MALTKKRRVFIEEYLKCWSQTEAARRAGYKNPAVMGCRLMKVQGIADLVKERIGEKCMGADEVLMRLAEQARADPDIFIAFGERGEWKIDIEKAKTHGQLHLIKKVKASQWGYEVEMYDAQRALELIGKHHALFVNRTEISGAGGGPIETRHAGLTDVDRLAALTAIYERIRDADTGRADNGSD